jgi:phosphoglycolate phosphatase-like HAD superfamily hydrolase
MGIKIKAIICDLDGTLCDTSKRVHFVRVPKGIKKDWKNFNKNISYDEIHEWCYELIFAMFFRGFHVIFTSGRSDEFKGITLEWLVDKFNEDNMRMLRPSLFMRKAGDSRRDDIVKTEIYKQFIEPKYDVLFAIDDRPSVCRAWRSLGIQVLQCGKGEEF